MTNSKALIIIKTAANKIWYDAMDSRADSITLAKRMKQTAELILAEIESENDSRLTSQPDGD